MRAQRSNESPGGAFKRQNDLAPARWRGLAPTSSAHDAQNADNARKNTAFPLVCKKCAKVCRAPENGKSHEESCDSSWDFGALEGTRIPGPLIKSQMLYRLSYERIFCSNTMLPNNITINADKMQVPGRKFLRCTYEVPPAGTLSGRTVSPQARWRDFIPTSSSLQNRTESLQSKQIRFGLFSGQAVPDPAAILFPCRRYFL